ncbi:MAG TPA: ArsB/NhaD family transporter [Limnochordia bacterium]|nr:ArsB/NhaD family transporter [Limnochordia bacterium]
MRDWGATAILIVCMGLIFRYPRRQVWWSAGAALCCLVGGWFDLGDVWRLARETGPVLTFLAGMLLVSAVAERGGVFAFAAGAAARAARGSARLALALLFTLGTLITIIFSLDTTAVVLTPLVATFVRAAALDPLPFVLATIYAANMSSLLLPVSNLTNLLAQGAIGARFWTFTGRMALPELAVAGGCLALLLIVFRRPLQSGFAAAAAPVAPLDGFGRATLVGLAAVVAGIGLAPLARLPLWLPAVVGGAGLALLALARRRLSAGELRREVAWGVLPFAFGLFITVGSALAGGLGALALTAAAHVAGPTGFTDLLGVAAASALGANLVNNLPMYLLTQGALVGAAAPPAGLYAALIGVNVGPNLSVVGSLATLLALGLYARRGLTVTPGAFLRHGLVFVPVLLLVGVAALWAGLRL